MPNPYEVMIGPVRIPRPEMDPGDARRLVEFLEKELGDGNTLSYEDQIFDPWHDCEETDNEISRLLRILGQRRGLILKLIAKLKSKPAQAE